MLPERRGRCQARPSKGPTFPAKALTEEEARRLLAAAVGTPWHAFFTLAFCTGARRAELAALRWSNVDLERATVTISESVVRTKTGLEFKGTKTGCVRVVPLNGLAIAALRSHRAKQNAKRLRKGDEYEVRDLVFADPLGGPWNPGSISNAFDRMAREVKLSTTRLHDVRHSAATWLLQGGVDVRTVAAILGHSTPVTTLNTYAHVMPGAEAKAVEAIAERLARVASGGSYGHGNRMATVTDLPPKKAQKTHGMAGSRTRTSFRTADFRTTMALATATFAFVVRTVP